MSKQTPVGNPIYSLLPTEVEGFGPLAELALDMRWSWSHYADDVWRQLEPALWELTQNPWAVLQTVSRDKLRHMLADPAFREKIDALVQASRQAAETPAWFQQTCSQSPLTCVAYFSMEFMLSEALPIYSGGLGNVAGDQLKAASDLGVPAVAVGLLYQQGYFRQVIDKDGAQQALFPYNDPGQLPITPLRHPSGEWLQLELDLPGYPVWLRVWQVQVGRIKLYLLDSNAAAYRKRAADNGAVGSQVANWQHTLEQKWPAVSFGEVNVQTEAAQHIFKVQVRLNDLEPTAVRVELCADGVMGSAPVRQEMQRAGQLAGASGGYVYSAAVSAARPPTDYTARVTPHRDGVAVPLENARILWQR